MRTDRLWGELNEMESKAKAVQETSKAFQWGSKPLESPLEGEPSEYGVQKFATPEV